MPSDFGDHNKKELVHLPHVVNPHDLQGWLEESGQPGQTERDSGVERDGFAVGVELSFQTTRLEPVNLAEAVALINFTKFRASLLGDL